MVLVTISVDSPSFMIRIVPVSLIDIVGVVSIHLGRFAIASVTECWQAILPICLRSKQRRMLMSLKRNEAWSVGANIDSGET